jgi:hypothetical protein
VKPANVTPLSSASLWLEAAARAASWATATLLVAVTGSLIVQGHDGLALTLGVSGATILWAGLVGPLVSRSNATPGRPSSVANFLAEQTQSRVVGTLAAIVLTLALAGVLAAELTIAWKSLALVFGSASRAALVVALAAIAGTILPGVRNVRVGSAGAIGFVITILTLLGGLAALAASDGMGVLVSIPTMSEVTNLELGLLERRLADPATFKPHAVPFLRVDALNFAGLIVSLSVGLALLATPPTTHIEEAAKLSRIDRRAVLLIAALLVLLPPLAVAAKRALLTWSSAGVRANALPDWTQPYRELAVLQICGSTSQDAAIITKACGKGIGPQGNLRWHETAFAPDSILFAALDSTGASAAAASLAILAIALAVCSANRISALATRTNAPSTTAKRWINLMALLTIASVLAATQAADSVKLLTGAAALAAAGLAPTLIASILRPRAVGANTAAVAIALGTATTLALIVGASAAPIELFKLTSALSAAPASVAKKLTTLHDLWLSAPIGPGRDALLVQAEKLARDNLAWLGLRPQNAGIIGSAIGAAVLSLGALLTVSLKPRTKV